MVRITTNINRNRLHPDVILFHTVEGGDQAEYKLDLLPTSEEPVSITFPTTNDNIQILTNGNRLSYTPIDNSDGDIRVVLPIGVGKYDRLFSFIRSVVTKKINHTAKIKVIRDTEIITIDGSYVLDNDAVSSVADTPTNTITVKGAIIVDQK